MRYALREEVGLPKLHGPGRFLSHFRFEGAEASLLKRRKQRLILGSDTKLLYGCGEGQVEVQTDHFTVLFELLTAGGKLLAKLHVLDSL